MIRHAKSECSDYVTISLGVSTFITDRNTDPADIIKSADKALFFTKQKIQAETDIFKYDYTFLNY